MIPFAETLQQPWQRRLSTLLNVRSTPKKAPSITRSAPHLIHGSVSPPESLSKRYVDRFSRFCTTHRRMSHYFTMGLYVYPPKMAPSLGDRVSSNTWYLGPARLINSNGISIGSAVFVWVQVLCCTVHCQWEWGINPQDCPYSLGFRHPAEPGGGPSHGDRQHAQKLVKIAHVVQKICLRTDRQTDRHTDTRMRRAHYNTSPPLPRAMYIYFICRHR